MQVRLFYHDRCFDGACSAAVFADFYRQAFDPSAEFTLTGLFHRAEQLFDEELFDGDENAIVDFKYCASTKLTWWFDHHQSAFLLLDHLDHEARQMPLGKPFLHRRRQQKPRLPVDWSEIAHDGLHHARANQLIPSNPISTPGSSPTGC